MSAPIAGVSWHVHYERATGRIIQISSQPPTLAPGEAYLENQSFVSPSEYRVNPDTLLVEALPPPAPPLDLVKRLAVMQVDDAAEHARLAFITGGAGQALEYQQTEWEARAWVAALEPDLVDYPFLKAEVDAIAGVTGQAVEPATVASSVMAQAEAWREAGSQIKRLRRTAKLAIDAATTVEEIEQARNIAWPQPVKA